MPPHGSVNVAIGLESAALGQDSPTEPTRFGIRVGKQMMRIDLTDMLERIACAYHEAGEPPAGPSPPTKTLPFKPRGGS